MLLGLKNVSHLLLASSKTLIGQKYGLRPLPRRVDADEFEILKDQIINALNEDLTIKFEFESTKDVRIAYELVNIIDDCYKLDTNPQPKKYRLLPISKIIPDYVSSDHVKREAAAKFWDAIHLRLSKLLRLGADSALSSGLITAVKRDRYFVSSRQPSLSTMSPTQLLALKGRVCLESPKRKYLKEFTRPKNPTEARYASSETSRT